MLKRFLLFALLAALAMAAPTPSEGQSILKGSRIWLYNNSDSSAVNSTTGIIRYDPLTGKYRFYNALTGTWFSYPLTGGGGTISLGSLNGTTKSANGAAISGSTLYMQTADATYPGLVSTGAQTFVGSKTFSSNATFNGWVTLNSRVPIGTNSFFLADATNGFRVHNSDNTAVRFKVHDSGQTDIGGPLNVTASTGTYGTFDHSVAGAAYLNLRYNNTLYGYLGQSSGLVTGGAHTDFALRGENAIDFAIGSTRAARLTSTGLGIGTTTPNAPLQFSNTVENRKIVLAEYINNNHEFAGFGYNTGILRYQIPQTSWSHVWYAGTSSTTSNELMRLTGTGYLGIGVAAPAERLHVARIGSYGNVAQFEGGTTSYSTFIEHTSSATVIKNNLARHITLAPNGVHHFVFNHTGDFNAAGVGTATDWVATSDRRLKENIKPVGPQLEKVEAIAALVRNYDRKDNGKNETGFIAQELAEVAPEYVNEGSDSVMWSVNYSKMVVPLYTAITELKAEIEELKAENQKLKSKRRRK